MPQSIEIRFATMSNSIINMHPYPYDFDSDSTAGLASMKKACSATQASRIRSIMHDAWKDPTKIMAMTCSYDALSSKMAEQAGFPVVFLSGFTVAASLALPDTGYVAFNEMCQKISETRREVKVPIIVDGDTGYGSPMNVKRAVKG